jgi:predicted nucleic acid-binding protein
MEHAVEIARTYDTTVYDGTFAALAESLGATFVTADERLVRRLEALPFVRFLGRVADV